jgi:hypothetical protein
VGKKDIINLLVILQLKISTMSDGKVGSSPPDTWIENGKRVILME